ncbi:MAG: ABC transporter ATP-binding protein, partial [Cyanobacteria bacterium J06555_13]
MQKFLNVLGYYRDYWRITLFSAGIISIFQIIDLFVPYATGQILNIISQQSVDGVLQRLIDRIAIAFNQT